MTTGDLDSNLCGLQDFEIKVIVLYLQLTHIGFYFFVNDIFTERCAT